MWTCSEIRQAARNRIRLSLWPVILVTFIYSALLSVLPLFNAVISMTVQWPWLTGAISIEEMVPITSAVNSTSSLINLAQVVLVFLIFNPMYVGYIRYLGSIRGESQDVGSDIKGLFWAFRENRYGGVVSGTSWKQLWMMIWSWAASAIIIVPAMIMFVFLIVQFISGISGDRGYNDYFRFFSQGAPENVLVWVLMFFGFFLVAGIGVWIILMNRFYAYLFTEFVLAERTDLSYKAALDLSKQMTQGLKMKLFLLELSFIGWHLLSVLTLYLLQLWIMPYRISAFQEVYERRKQEMGILMYPQAAEPQQAVIPNGDGARG